jgi:hypothetical protein
MKNLKTFGVIAVFLVVVLGSMSLLLSAPHAFAVGPNITSYFITAPSGSDPCQNPSVAKASASVAITSATTTALVTPTTGNFISLCKFQFTVVGTNPTVQFEYGTVTSTACDTGATALTGAMAIPTTTIFVGVSSDGLMLRTPVVSQELCLVTGGTITGVEGYITYVSQPY